MIETTYHILPETIFEEVKEQAQELNVSVDYYLMEFCQLEDEE